MDALKTAVPNAYDVRSELRQHIELYRTGRIGSDQHPERVAWVIACFERALEELGAR